MQRKPLIQRTPTVGMAMIDGFVRHMQRGGSVPNEWGAIVMKRRVEPAWTVTRKKER